MANMVKDLHKEYGLQAEVSIETRMNGSLRYWVKSGSYTGEACVQWVYTFGDTLAEAAHKHRQEREAAAKIDPHEDLKKKAAEAGFELVPAAKPLDLQPCRDS